MLAGLDLSGLEERVIGDHVVVNSVMAGMSWTPLPPSPHRRWYNCPSVEPNVYRHAGEPEYPLDQEVAGQYTFIRELGFMNRRIQMGYRLLVMSQREEKRQKNYRDRYDLTKGWMDSDTGKIMTW